MIDQDSTREKIKAAALEEFVERGYDGARMQEIANRAGANKAMIHYYFQSKDALFEAILRETFEELAQLFSQVWESEKSTEELISATVHAHFKFLAEHPHLPRILVRELNSNNPIVDKVVQELFEQTGYRRIRQALDALAAGIKAHKLRQTDPKQTIWNIIALNLFFFIAKPLLQVIWKEEFKNEKELLAKRETAIIDLLLYGLLPR
ncbi:MAG: TetR/AcrR family transcriptional regulator [candidate division KSB1 bacterium]|nr:TetR/AcrR family transcriptional regulator [candidate division KSB1 bacterium]MDZ7317648.1 TetR/AcrR family transcriptional regulator [candidate division KSB1 bacterium]MDZ7341891.1 TetR/AcrR family transcriptional regulator [candidate division KSB1 bacterium]